MSLSGKSIRKALLTAKTVAGSIDPMLKRTELKKGGRAKMFAGGDPGDGNEPSLPLQLDQGATPVAPHTIFDMDGETNFHSGPLRAGKHSRYIKRNRVMVSGPEDNEAVERHVLAHPVDSVIGSTNLHRMSDPGMRLGQAKRAHKFLKPGGKAYFQIDEGNGSGVPGKDQHGFVGLNRPAAMYMNEIKKVFPKVRRVEHVIIAEKDRPNE